MNREFQELELKEHFIEEAKQLNFEENEYLAEHTKQLTAFDLTVTLVCIVAAVALVYFAE
jgi:hypothetical protein